MPIPPARSTCTHDRRQIECRTQSRKTLQPAAQGQNQPRAAIGQILRNPAKSSVCPGHKGAQDRRSASNLAHAPATHTANVSGKTRSVRCSVGVTSRFSSFSRRCLGDSFFRRVPYRQLNQVGRRRQIECGIGCSNSWRRDAVTGAEQSTSSGRRGKSIKSNGRASSRQRKGYLQQ